ncbi:dienelactone hydrolase family protein [Oceanobacter mangrovi]|uniref:dienelactone hydrolase family protein n=1 Tax=Oceanobacter mangrovi TaxID=2862510 RepID=UPI001C8D8F3F|nr:dienelactone hydrolase family protein [Oceanobacter mangrovi]
MKRDHIDPKIYELYDEYCHTGMSRRDFLSRASSLTIVGGSGLAMAQALLPNYANAEEVLFTDDRIKANWVEYPSPGGSSGSMRGYLVQPAGKGPFPAVVIIHENRGLNPYIKDVARRAAVAGFLALAPDGLAPIGGYPGNDDEGKQMQASLDQEQLYKDMLNSAWYVKKHPLSNGKLGATGFCYGGGVVNQLAVDMGKDLDAGVPFYGRAPALEDVVSIEAAMMIQYAEDDPRINAMRSDYEQALKASGTEFVIYSYPNTRHGFHNYSTPRYNEEQAKLAWRRTTEFFDQKLI